MIKEATLAWSATVKTDEGPERLDGAMALKDAPAGAVLQASRIVHLSCDLPTGTISSISATMEIPLGPDGRIFMNGYQSWTECHEYTRASRIRGLHGVPKKLVELYQFDRYGDYHFADYPNRRGVTHGFSYCYFRHGTHFTLIASLDERPGYTQFLYDANKALLTIARDCANIVCSGPYAAFDLFFAEGTEDEVFDAWFSALGIARPAAPHLSGYSSWYNRFEKISDFSIKADLVGCKSLLRPGDLFQIDDGWEPHVGDWLEPDVVKFPHGMKAMVDEIHEAGFIAGLWLAPFVAQEGSALQYEHPDWFFLKDGRPWGLGTNWGGFFSLDIDNPEVLAYLRRVFDRVFNDWGFDLVKVDFLYGAAPFGTANETRAARMIRAMDFLREVCAGKLILGCGVPLMPAFGRVDYCRIGPDVSLDWNGEWYMKMFHRERASTKNSLLNTIFRRELNGRAFQSDPDVVFLRDFNIKLTRAEKEQQGAVDALLGSVLLTSDEPIRYTDEEREAYRQLRQLSHAKNIRVEEALGGKERSYRIRYELDGIERTFDLTKALFEDVE